MQKRQVTAIMIAAVPSFFPEYAAALHYPVKRGTVRRPHGHDHRWLQRQDRLQGGPDSRRRPGRCRCPCCHNYVPDIKEWVYYQRTVQSSFGNRGKKKSGAHIPPHGGHPCHRLYPSNYCNRIMDKVHDSQPCSYPSTGRFPDLHWIE